MSQQFFINPYTFIPLNPSGPLCKVREAVHRLHAYLEAAPSFTGRIRCRLTFLTPAVIPGEQRPGTETEPGKKVSGEIEPYSYQGCLAIPGSRLRGHLLHLMRTINSSPVTSYNDRVILERAPAREEGHRKGFIVIENSGKIKIQEINKEFLLVHPERREKPTLDNNCVPEETCPAAIPDYQPSKGYSQGFKGDIHYQIKLKYVPREQRYKREPFKKYLAQVNSGNPKREPGTHWVRFPAWSGQDGETRLKDIKNKRLMHWNQYHIVDLGRITADSLPLHDLDETLVRQFEAGVDEMAQLLEDRADNTEDKKLARKAQKMKDLKAGTFVYFELNNARQVISLGRHYRYLFRKGTVVEKVKKANKESPGQTRPSCLVQQLAGEAAEKDKATRKYKGLKSRLWVDLALGPNMADVALEEKNLRILSSQPPKCHRFYLRGGEYDAPNSEIRGRKFYWHDPKWKDPLWDNQDLREGAHAYENPQPDEDRLKKQWSRAKVIPPGTSFEFDIRAQNLNEDELKLLLTALVGMSPAMVTAEQNRRILAPENREFWCHKIGHARPFLGSAAISIIGAKQVSFDLEGDNWAPKIALVDLNKWQQDLAAWQQILLKDAQGVPKYNHLKCLARVMHFHGAYQAKEGEKQARIAYPLGQNKAALTWKGLNLDEQPKTYIWFGQNRGNPPDLPEPKPGIDQALQVFLDNSRGQHNPQGRHNRGGRR